MTTNNDALQLTTGFPTPPSDIHFDNTAYNFQGGKIGSYASIWAQYTKCSWIRATLAGHVLEFRELPSLRAARPLRLARRDQRALDVALDEYERCHVIEEVLDDGGESYVSTVFPVLKRDGVSARVILNLKPLNPYIVYSHFKMDNLYSVLPMISQGCWFASLDLMNAYLTVPVRMEDRKWLRFLWKDKLYQYTCMPQGLTSAPRIFTRLLKPIMAHLRSVGITAIIYIDDVLLLAPSREELAGHVDYLVGCLTALG